MKLPRSAWVAAGAALALTACAKNEEKVPLPGPPVQTQERTDPSAPAPETVDRAVVTRVEESGLAPTAVAALRADYPLATCPISGKALGSMGDPVEVLVWGQLVRLCCEKCIPEVEADPAAVLGRIDAAVEAARGS